MTTANFTYLFILLGAFLFPLLIGFHPRSAFNKKAKLLFVAFSITALLFVSWDCIFTALGVWGFNEHFITGIHFFNLPIEEVMFFFLIPYCCLLIYDSLQKSIQLNFNTRWISFSLAIFCLAIALVFHDRLYTFYTALLASVLLIFIAIKNWKYLSYFYVMFAISMIPFLIVNGLLTGTCLNEPVVWYNNLENTAHRLLTIPYEDILYGFDLLLMNVIIYEQLQSKD